HATAGFQGSGRALRVERLDARLLGLQARGQVALSQASPTASPIERADLQLQIDDLRPLGQLLGQPLRGTGAGQLRVDGQSGELTLALRELSAGADEALRLGRLELSGKARALHATPDIDLSLVASQLRAPMPAPAATPAATRVVSAAAAVTRDPDTLFIEQLSLTARGPMSRLSLRTDAQGWHGERVVSLDARATGRLWRTTRQLRIERLEARYGSEQARLQQPLELAREGALTRIQSLDLLIGQEGSEPGRVQGSMSLAPGRLQTDLQLERLPLDLAGRLEFAPIVAGELNGTLRLNADARAGARAETVNSGKARLVVDGLQIAGGPTRPVERIDATANAEWDGRELTLDGRVTRPLRTPLVVEARLPLRPDRDSLLSIPGDAQLQGNASWRGDLAELMVLTPPSDHVLAGQGVLDVRASGPVARPNLAGTLSIRDGHYENLLAGTLLEQLRLDTSFSQAGQARFDLSANDGANGTVTARGELRLSGESSRLDVQLATREALLVRLDEATVQSSSDLELSGALNDLRLGGQIQLDRGEIRLANPLPPSIVELEGVRIKGQPAPEADNAGGGAGLVRLDLKVLIPDQVFVRGRGLDSEWGGELDIGGYSDAPVVTGQIRARRGSLDFLGRNFKLQRGLVNFAGGRRIDPSLDINLERETSDLTGRILVTGTASNPQLSFESTPALPEDEVLPVILFGRSRQSLSALEAVQLAAGIATLTSGEASVVDRARAALGLDVLRVESSDKEDEASTVSVGRYVEDGVYVGARQSVDGKRSSVVVEVEVLDNVSIDADVGQGADTSVGVNWRKDF
ncbi:MAG: translocation/assembly module TamB, partial [Gammaproteobacteria bacterium]|nr:translocation/assembly module TamB [Gammaproteobacteria bacterium]